MPASPAAVQALGRARARLAQPERADAIVAGFPSEIRALASQAELTAAMTAAALDPTILADRTPYFWQATISTSRIDSYFTRMAESSLRNYAEDAKAGVAFQNSHNTRELPLGRSIYGDYRGPQGDGVAHVDAAFYTLAGLKLGALDTDQMIDGMRAGIIRDVSIGFYLGVDGVYRCSICGRDMLTDWDCWHYPGVEYALRDEENQKTGENAVAIADVENAHLAEVSAVYDGACPGAVILKAERDAVEGRLEERARVLLQQRYRLRLPDKARHVAPAPGMPAHNPTDAEEAPRMTASAGTRQTQAPAVAPDAPAAARTASQARTTPAETPAEGAPAAPATATPAETTAAPAAPAEGAATTPAEGASTGTEGASLGDAATAAGAETPAAPEGTIEEVARAVLARAAIPAAAGINPALRTMGDEIIRLRGRVRELEPLAVDGQAYRDALVEDAIKHGKRAGGATFEAKIEDWRTRLRAMDSAGVADLRDTWKAAADVALGNGRATSDDASITGPNGAPATPSAAPAARATRRAETPMGAYRG